MSETMWHGRRVFITGCTGLFGSWLTAVLVAKGAEVVGLLHKEPSQSLLAQTGTLQNIQTISGDIGDGELLQRVLHEQHIDTIFHLAAQTLVGVANQNPLSTFETNIKGTWVLLEAARQCPTIRCVIVASSDKAYGAQPELPYHEDAPLLGKHPYDASKACADLLTRTYAHTYNLPTAVTRCANLYGGGDFNWNRIVPGTIRSVLRGERPIVRSDGQSKRNYIYVPDAVRGTLLLAQAIERPDVCGEAFNFGASEAITALGMIQSIIRLSDHPELEPVILNEARHEIQEQNLCSDKAQRLLGWEPQYSLATSLQETIQWYRAYLQAH